MTNLDDPVYAAFAWGRFRRILKGMTLFAVVVAIASVLLLWWWIGALPIHMVIATFLGITLTIWLAAALMGLMFLSSGSGYDQQVIEPLEEEERR